MEFEKIVVLIRQLGMLGESYTVMFNQHGWILLGARAERQTSSPRAEDIVKYLEKCFADCRFPNC